MSAVARTTARCPPPIMPRLGKVTAALRGAAPRWPEPRLPRWRVRALDAATMRRMRTHDARACCLVGWATGPVAREAEARVRVLLARQYRHITDGDE